MSSNGEQGLTRFITLSVQEGLVLLMTHFNTNERRGMEEQCMCPWPWH